MLDYLQDREQEEMFRTSIRILDFPDGETRRVEAYRLIWRWFDRTVAYEFAPSADELLTWTLRCAAMENRELGDALGEVVNHIVAEGERAGLDYTDDNLALMLAKRGTAQFRTRKAQRKPDGDAA